MAASQRIPPVADGMMALFVPAESGPGATRLHVAPVQDALVAVATFRALAQGVVFLEAATMPGHGVLRNLEPPDETPGAGGAQAVAPFLGFNLGQ
jgi:hypothetical protein